MGAAVCSSQWRCNLGVLVSLGFSPRLPVFQFVLGFTLISRTSGSKGRCWLRKLDKWICDVNKIRIEAQYCDDQVVVYARLLESPLKRPIFHDSNFSKVDGWMSTRHCHHKSNGKSCKAKQKWVSAYAELISSRLGCIAYPKSLTMRGRSRLISSAQAIAF